jgi:moderate conductance mechanosensitive channel
MPLSTLATSLAAQVGPQPAPVTSPTAAETLPLLARILAALTVIAIELVIVVAVCTGLYWVTMTLLRAAPIPANRPGWRDVGKLKARHILLATAVALGAGVLAANGYLLVRGVDVSRYTADLVGSITPDTWIGVARELGTLALAIIGLLVVNRLVRRPLRAVERLLNRWHLLDDSRRSLDRLFGMIERTIVHVGWMLIAVYASIVLGAPAGLTGGLLLALRIYLVLAIGLIVIRSTAVVVVTLDALSHRYATRRDWLRHYEHLRSLLPTLRVCLEYALWVGVASLVLVQFGSMRNVAAWGPRVIQGIAIFFAGRVLIELGRLEIGHRMLPREGLDESERRRRATMVPLVRSAFTYAVYFGTAVLILGVLGFNPMPFLAGAGLLGLVIGFGAQSLINDVVSGFFILLENIYLVGDMVEVGPARGVVEAIEFRTTRIRDAEGRVHVIRNGDMKPVINYSKDYGVAVVAVEVPYDADLKHVFASLRQASDRLRTESRDVLTETQIDGISAFGASTMTIRTATRVRAGHHEAVAAALRLFINETFDRQAVGVPRKTLIGDRYAKHAAAHGA